MRKFRAQQKLELVMASLCGERSIAELCREHQISESLLRRWGDAALEAAGERLAGGPKRFVGSEQRKRIADLERALGKQDVQAGNPGKGRLGVGVSERVTYACVLVAAGHRAAVVARVLQISRRAISRVPKPRRAPTTPG